MIQGLRADIVQWFTAIKELLSVQKTRDDKGPVTGQQLW